MKTSDIRKKIISILDNELEATAADDTNLYIVPESVEKAADEIMKLFEEVCQR